MRVHTSTILSLSLLLLLDLLHGVVGESQSSSNIHVDSNGQLVFDSGNTTLALQDLANLFHDVSSLRSAQSTAISTNAQLTAQLNALSSTIARQSAALNSLCSPSPSGLSLLYTTFQSIFTSGANDWEFFSINDQSYLAVANFEDDTGNNNINSQIFKLNTSSSSPDPSFVLFQSIPTSGANDWEYFTMNNQSYLAMANFRNRNGAHAIDSPIFRFNGSNFVLFQSVPTSGATGWKYFTINNQSYLAVANHYSDSASHNQNSQIFKFNSTSNSFVAFQSIPTNGASEWEFFTIAMMNDSSSRNFLAVANSNNDTSWNINTQIFVFNGSQFVLFQTLSVNGAVELTFFTISSVSYLAIASYRSDQDGVNTNSQIFRF